MNKELEAYVSRKIKDFLKSNKVKYENLKIDIMVDDTSYSVDFLLDYNCKRMCFLDLVDDGIISEKKFEKEVEEDIIRHIRSSDVYRHGKVNKITLTESDYSNTSNIFESVRFLNEPIKDDRMVNIQLFGKSCSLPVTFYVYPGEEITLEQEQSLKTFLKMKEWKNSEEIYKSLEHIALIDADAIWYNGKLDKDSIINMITPNNIFVLRKSNKVCIMCNDYKLDPEHGLAILFKDGKFSDIVMQDYVL